MNVIYSDAHREHQPQFESYDGEPAAYPEVAGRVDAIMLALRSRGLGRIYSPKHFPLEHTLAIHNRRYVDFLRRKSEAVAPGQQLYPSYFITDTYAPLTRGTFRASVAAVDIALTGADQLLGGQAAVYSLCRPPGHHAAHHSLGGYCYFNNAAIAAHYLSQHGKVAILDIDYHHGNGTQAAFYHRSDVLYVSLHADPATNYPYITGFADETGAGVGRGYNLNVPLPTTVGARRYLAALDTGIEKVRQFKPDHLIVSAGFDTYIDDPVGGMRLSQRAYSTIGRHISGLNLPTLIIQEGGYAVDQLGEIVADFLEAFRK